MRVSYFFLTDVTLDALVSKMRSLLVPSSFESETEAAQRAFDYLISEHQTGNEKECGETCKKKAIEGHFLFARVLLIFHSRIFFLFCLRSKRSEASEELLSCSLPSEELLSYSGYTNTIRALRSLKRLLPGACVSVSVVLGSNPQALSGKN